MLNVFTSQNIHFGVRWEWDRIENYSIVYWSSNLPSICFSASTHFFVLPKGIMSLLDVYIGVSADVTSGIWIHSKASVVSIIKYIYVSIVLIHLKQFSRVLPGKSMNFLVAIKLMSCCELLQRGKPNDKEQTMTVVYMCIFYSMQCKIALPG